MKKLLFILIPSFLLALILFLSYQYFVKYKSQKGALQVTSAPESKVYLNNNFLGQTPLCKCEATDMLQAGEYVVKLVPLDKSLQEFQEKITISEAVLTVVDRKFGKVSQSEGSVISLSPLSDKKKAELLVVSFPEKATVMLDNDAIGESPISYKDPTESDHILKVSKNGYKEKTVRIRTPLGYKLTVAVYLATSTDIPQVSPTIAASPSAALTPAVSPTGTGAKVTILETPTGFLRVRSESSTTAPEIARIGPGESYPLVSEQEGWYEITLKDGTTGWISSDYAKK